MKDYIFTKTCNSSRGGLMVNFPLWDKKMFIFHFLKSGKEWRDQYRYGKIGSYMYNFKDMSLEEFDKIFPEQPFTVEQITELFRKEVSLKYGEHKRKSELKTVPAKDIVLGGIYIDINGDKWVNLGLVKKIIDKGYYKPSYNREKYPIIEQKGHGYIDLDYYLKYPSEIADRAQVMKTKKRFVSIDESRVDLNLLPEEIIYLSGASSSSWANWERKVQLIIHKKLK